MATTIGSLLAQIGLDTANFDNGIKKVKKQTAQFAKEARWHFKRVRRSINNMGGAFTRLTGIIVGLVGPAAMGALVKKSLEVIDATVKLADTFNITTAALEGLTLAAERNGATAEQVKKSLEKLAVNGQDAADGIGTAADAFKKLNIDAKELVKLPLDEQFRVVADSMKNVKTATERVSIAYDIFGRQGTNMVKTLRLSREELDAFEERVITLGVAVNRFDSAKVEEANDAFMEAGKAVQGLGNIMAVEVAPMITALSNGFVDASIEANGFRDEVKNGMSSIVNAVGWVMDTLHGVKVAFKVLVHGVQELVNLGVQGLALFAEATVGIQNAFVRFGNGVIDVVHKNVWPALKFLIDKYNTVAEIFGRPLIDTRQVEDFLTSLKGEEVNFEDTVFGRLAAQSSEAITLARADLLAMLEEPLPSEALKEYVREAIETANKHAETVVKVQEETSKTMEEINEKGQEFNRKLAESIKVDLFDKSTTVFDQIRNSFADLIKGMINDWINSGIQNLFSNMNGSKGGGIGGFVSSIFSFLPGFATGGQFTVGGKSGRDANLVPLKLTKGETVTITPPGMGTAQNGGNVTIHNEFDFRGSSLDESYVLAMIEKSQQQLRAQMLNDRQRGRTP